MIGVWSKVKHIHTGQIGEVLKLCAGQYAVFHLSSGDLEWWDQDACKEYFEPKTKDLAIRLTINTIDEPKIYDFVRQHDISGMCDIKEVTNDNH